MKTPEFLKEDDWKAEQQAKWDWYMPRIAAIVVVIILFAFTVFIYRITV